MIIEERGRAKGEAVPPHYKRTASLNYRMELPTSEMIIPRLGAPFKYERMEVTA